MLQAPRAPPSAPPVYHLSNACDKDCSHRHCGQWRCDACLFCAASPNTARCDHDCSERHCGQPRCEACGVCTPPTLPPSHPPPPPPPSPPPPPLSPPPPPHPPPSPDPPEPSPPPPESPDPPPPWPPPPPPRPPKPSPPPPNPLSPPPLSPLAFYDTRTGAGAVIAALVLTLVGGIACVVGRWMVLPGRYRHEAVRTQDDIDPIASPRGVERGERRERV